MSDSTIVKGYHPNGQVKSIDIVKGDILITKNFDSKGKLVEKIVKIGNVVRTIQKDYYADGNLRSRIVFYDDTLSIQEFLHYNGQLVKRTVHDPSSKSERLCQTWNLDGKHLIETYLGSDKVEITKEEITKVDSAKPNTIKVLLNMDGGKLTLSRLALRKLEGTSFDKKEYETGDRRSKTIRSNPDLIKVIEKLGDLAGEGSNKYEIVEIPVNCDYEVREHKWIKTEYISEIPRKWLYVEYNDGYY